MCGLARIDGHLCRFIGPKPSAATAMIQRTVTVWPTRTIYHFEARGVELILTFLTPALLHDLEVLARPVTYVTFSVRSIDGRPHSVSIYLDCLGDWVVNTSEQLVVWGRYRIGNMQVLRIGSQEQAILQKSGDDLRIDWGYLHLAMPEGMKGEMAMGQDVRCRESFERTGHLPDSDDLEMPRSANTLHPALACVLDLGEVGDSPKAGHLLLAYDEVEGVEYMHQRLAPFWRRNKTDTAKMLSAAAADFSRVERACEEFDASLMADLERVGGWKYAYLCALAYRQCIAAHALVAHPMERDTPLFFSKENFSNGCIATVDVTYPSAPLFLLLNPALLKGMLTPVFRYAALPRWKFPYAPHDLGTYPLANGQKYGGGEETEENQMPVEECGNMLILSAAIARVEDSHDYALLHWPLLEGWAEYLRDKGFDPENQLCTDDFAGHLAHNTNLSIKAILGLASFALLCRMKGEQGKAVEYRQIAEKMAAQWILHADDGDHYRLAFDQPGTWSQKYNLIWDQLIGLNAFPKTVIQKEIAYYRTKIGHCGIPLDSRKTYTKLDFSLWTATLSGSDEDFACFMDAIYRFPNESASRVPLGDWYHTHNGEVIEFRARSVVGGLFIKLLMDRMNR